jgi:hypothetical protein
VQKFINPYNHKYLIEKLPLDIAIKYYAAMLCIVFENRVPRCIFGPKREAVTEE